MDYQFLRAAIKAGGGVCSGLHHRPQSPHAQHDLDITDTEYAPIIAQGYDPNLERQLIELGESLEQARKLARVVGLTQDKAPQTDDEWQEFMAVWGERG